MSESSKESSGTCGEAGKRRLPVTGRSCLNTMDKKLNVLNEKVDKLLNFQEDVSGKLESMYRGIGDLERGISKIAAASKTDLPWDQAQVQTGCPEMLEMVRAVQRDTSRHSTMLEGLVKMVTAVDKAMTLIGMIFQNSKLVDFIVQGSNPWRKGSLADAEILEENKEKAEEKGAKPKHALSTRGVQAEIRRPLEESQKAESLEGKNQKLPSGTLQDSAVNSDSLRGEGASLRQKDGDSGPTSSQRPLDCPLSSKDTVSKDPVKASAITLGHPDWTAVSQGNSEVSQGQVEPGRVEQGDMPGQFASWSSEKVAKPGPSSSTEVLGALPQPMGAQGGGMPPRLSIHVQETDTPGEMLVSRAGDSSEKILRPKALASLSSEGEGSPCGQDIWVPIGCFQPSRTDPTLTDLEGKSGEMGQSQHDLQGKERGAFLLGTNDQKTAVKSESEGELAMEHSTAQKDGERCHWTQVNKREAQEMEPRSLKTQEQQQREKPQLWEQVGPAEKAGGLVLDDSPAPPAPFEHRIVSVKEVPITTGYIVCQHEVLGGGRFGQVHKCTEKSTGLCLAAKIIKVKSAKDREEVKNEINIMNQLSHVNLIQLYDAFESKNSFTLVMEYVDGGELFDRITDEKYHLTELDAVLFTRQICEGLHYLHQHYILHLDLKPENILCVNQMGNQIKIIDFGLARRYKPREKLKVNFGTPEFLAPEVVNYDFVSFPTDMWSVGVITYMLLSGLSPFLGETDAETMNYIVNCSWDFDAEAFEGLMEEAKDFISRLLIKEKSCRMSAAQCLKHEWLNNLPTKATKSKVRLKSQILLRKYMAQRKWKKHFYAVTAANRLRKIPSCPQTSSMLL
ncbi:LOW QUALITY PROTEIN: myosin light chain kinase 3 [Monodelphis domestica]|uniref:LOW QUALITY PROTEIN: myosin light chain kinase 3 n=1 Tax=Monodelphis domestica TaxID=13616 RepID=UPI0024E1B527|nr:LOW QUALITY PROTEIN: myosin light chain kinase 3 [Monodelphis domestica]